MQQKADDLRWEEEVAGTVLATGWMGLAIGWVDRANLVSGELQDVKLSDGLCNGFGEAPGMEV